MDNLHEASIISVACLPGNSSHVITGSGEATFAASIVCALLCIAVGFQPAAPRILALSLVELIT